ncbi:MAG: hypothetical protein IPI49_14320 [Myxococcales bacterium]|nr:hypothetical protein [Myxococcales bacterium]
MRIIRRGLWAAAAWVLAACSGEPARTPEVAEVGQRVLGDHDDDGVLDAADLDDDNDGILDQVECPAPTLAAQEFWVMFNPNNSASGRRDVHVAGAAGTMVTIAGAAPSRSRPPAFSPSTPALAGCPPPTRWRATSRS